MSWPCCQRPPWFLIKPAKAWIWTFPRDLWLISKVSAIALRCAIQLLLVALMSFSIPIIAACQAGIGLGQPSQSHASRMDGPAMNLQVNISIPIKEQQINECSPRTLPESTCVFPEIGLPPVIIHFSGIFHYTPPILIHFGVPPFMETSKLCVFV